MPVPMDAISAWSISRRVAMGNLSSNWSRASLPLPSSVSGKVRVKQSPGQDQAGKTFDVLVVGSGASGGWVAKRLTEAGVRVALLDAGRAHTPADYREHTRPFELKYRNSMPDVIR